MRNSLQWSNSCGCCVGHCDVTSITQLRLVIDPELVKLDVIDLSIIELDHCWPMVDHIHSLVLVLIL